MYSSEYFIMWLLLNITKLAKQLMKNQILISDKFQRKFGCNLILSNNYFIRKYTKLDGCPKEWCILFHKLSHFCMKNIMNEFSISNDFHCSSLTCYSRKESSLPPIRYAHTLRSSSCFFESCRANAIS